MFLGCNVKDCLERVRLEAGRLWRRSLPPVRRETTEAWTRRVRSGQQPSNQGGGTGTRVGWWEGPGMEQIAVLGHSSAWGRARDRGVAGHAGWASARGEDTAPGAPRGTFCSSNISTVSEVPITACAQWYCLSAARGPRPPWALFMGTGPGHAWPVTIPLCSAFPGGRGGRRLGQSRGPRGGRPGSRGCSLVCHIPPPRGQVGRVVKCMRALGNGADQSHVSAQAVCPW